MGARTRGLANNVLTSGKLDATDALSGTIPASNIANASLTSATSFGSATGGVPAVASDPPSPSEGDIWYNTTSGQIKFRTQVGAWASGGNMNTARRAFAGAGTQTAGLGVSGYSTYLSPIGSEEYDGSTWTAGGNLGAARYEISGTGTQTAGLAWGGLPSTSPPVGNGFAGLTNTEEYDGTSWTAGGALPSANRGSAAAGIQTAALSAAGITGLTTLKSTSEEYDGSAWTAGGSLATARRTLGGAGTQTAGLAYGGATPSFTGATEEYNGTSWTAGGALNSARDGIAGDGLQTAALGFGGNTGSITNATEQYDGSTWTTVNSLNTARQQLAGSKAGSTTSALAFGGVAPPTTGATEEYSFGVATTVVG